MLNMTEIKSSPAISGILGVCVGDALGLPVQFEQRLNRRLSPVTEMIGYGVFNLPPGSWSDDSSLTLCLVDAIIEGDATNTEELLTLIAKNFCRWYTEGYLTPFDKAYDIGGATIRAVNRLLNGFSPQESGGGDENSNGNGSLMRILPIAFCHNLMSLPELLALSDRVSAITHAHPRARIACGIYISIAVRLLQGDSLSIAYQKGVEAIKPLYQHSPYVGEMHHFERVLDGDIDQLPTAEIYSSGYVVDTLEASLWCLLTTHSYSEALLKAVNLGEDTDTTAAVTGGLAGIYYGLEAIPQHWLNQLAKLDEIVELGTRFAAKFDC